MSSADNCELYTFLYKIAWTGSVTIYQAIEGRVEGLDGTGLVENNGPVDNSDLPNLCSDNRCFISFESYAMGYLFLMSTFFTL